MSTVLEGLRVLDFSAGMAGPLATMVLADYGAEVIKVEPQAGEWGRDEPAFAMWNRGKKSVVLDLPAQRDEALLLARTCDVVVESYRPGVAERLGIGYHDMGGDDSGLIYCSIDGFGRIPAVDTIKAYEGVVSAKAGMWSHLDDIQGAVGANGAGRPVFKVVAVNSYAASQLAVQAILAALRVREQTGVGQRVQTSLLQGAASLLMRTEFSKAESGEPTDDASLAPAPEPTVHRGIRMTFLTVQCGDGKWIQMCARQDHHFKNWMQAIGLGDVLEDERYAGGPMRIPTIADIEALEARIREAMSKRSQAEWMDEFLEHDVGCDPMLTPAEFLVHPQMVENSRVVEIEDLDGTRRPQPGPLVIMSRTAARLGSPAPGLGRDTETVLESALSAPRRSPVVTSAFAPDYPLRGVTVLELAYFLAAPLAGSLLAELGARVVKIEPPTGDPFRRVGTQAAPMLHGKESLAIDLKQEEGRAVLAQLVDQADVLYTSLRPQVHEKLGCDYASVHARNPQLVYLYAGSYGSKGPWSQRAAFHSTPNALCGAGILQAGRRNPPVDDSWPDPVSGLGAATAILLGLAARDRTGFGQYMETTMICSSAYAFSRELVASAAGDDFESLMPDQMQLGRSAFERLYHCGEGWLFLNVVHLREWEALANALGLPALLADPRFATIEACREHAAELEAVLSEAFGRKSSSEWEDELIPQGVPAVAADAPGLLAFMSQHDLLTHEQHPLIGEYWRLPAPFGFSGSLLRSGPACGIGEQTRSILEELEYAEDEIDRLVSNGVVVAPRATEGASA